VINQSSNPLTQTNRHKTLFQVKPGLHPPAIKDLKQTDQQGIVIQAKITALMLLATTFWAKL
jgi:hypothetical protein